MPLLFVATLEKTIFEGEVPLVVIPGASGYFEVLKDHAPLISSLVPGKLSFTDLNGKEYIYAISGGVAEVSNNEVKVLGDAIESKEEIDLNRAQAAIKRALRFLDSDDSAVDYTRSKKALARAKNRLKIAEENNR